VEGDAADDQTIARLVAQAIEEEGRLDVFFANVSCLYADLSSERSMDS
jgi:NAD(P)-dependent dehydrogenase (short-subunit alcohol dehydrogenase family)